MVTEAKPGFACGAQDPNGVFQIRMNNVTREGELVLSKRRRVPASVRNIKSYLLAPGDVLFNATNSPDGVGKSAFVSKLDEPTVFSNHFLRLRTDGSRLDPAFLTRWLNLQFDRGVFQGMCRQWVNQATVGREALLQLEVPLPSVREQRRIAAVLDQADVLRAKRREAIAHLDTLTQSIFLQMFGDPVENPRGLPIRALDAWVDPDRPVTYGILKPGPEIPNGVPYVRVAEMRDGGIALPGVRRTSPEIARQYRRSTLRAGDLLISIRGHVGRMADVPVVLDGANITQDSARLAIDPRSVEYVRATLQSTRLQAWMARRTKGAAVQGLNLGDLRLAPLPVPPLREQEEFGRLARGMRRNGEIARRQLVECEALAASLCDRAFKGEL